MLIALYHQNWKNNTLKIGLKSSIISKVDHQTSKNWKKCSKPFLKTTNKFWGPIVHGDQLSWGPFVHGDQMFGDCLSRGTNCLGDHLSMGTKFLGTNCPGGPIVLGTKWAGTVCSWGPIVGDQMSGDWMCSGPNENQPCNTLIGSVTPSKVLPLHLKQGEGDGSNSGCLLKRIFFLLYLYSVPMIFII